MAIVVRVVVEIRRGFSAGTRMVRFTAAVPDFGRLRSSQRHPPSGERVAAGHELSHARRLQTVPCTRSVLVEGLPQR